MQEISRNVLLVFPQEVMYKPLIYRLAREFDLVFNILEAKILPRREGRLILELKGSPEAVERGVSYLTSEGVLITSHRRRDPPRRREMRPLRGVHGGLPARAPWWWKKRRWKCSSTRRSAWPAASARRPAR